MLSIQNLLLLKIQPEYLLHDVYLTDQQVNLLNIQMITWRLKTFSDVQSADGITKMLKILNQLMASIAEQKNISRICSKPADCSEQETFVHGSMKIMVLTGNILIHLCFM